MSVAQPYFLGENMTELISTEDILARLSERQRQRISELTKQRDGLLTATKEALDILQTFEDRTDSLKSLKVFLRYAIADAEKR